MQEAAQRLREIFQKDSYDGAETSDEAYELCVKMGDRL
jgi:hypothetical protein